MGAGPTQASKIRKGSRYDITPQINVTPLVDVMLVLLVIFMITSPLLVGGVSVDLPETKAGAIKSENEPLVVTVDKSGTIYIADTPVDKKELTEKLLAISGEKKDTRVFVRGDQNVSYGDVMNVMGEIHSAGFTKVALISNIKNNEKK
jgi:biopolymer transport protein TolR